jgi:uncharacterized protein YgbK (DUF1537 family)
MDRIGIIADDLTGANDTGAQFSRRGWATSVAWDGRWASEPGGEEVDVRALDTEGRSLDARAARKRAAAAARSLQPAGCSSAACRSSGPRRRPTLPSA